MAERITLAQQDTRTHAHTREQTQQGEPPKKITIKNQKTPPSMEKQSDSKRKWPRRPRPQTVPRPRRRHATPQWDSGGFWGPPCLVERKLQLDEECVTLPVNRQRRLLVPHVSHHLPPLRVQPPHVRLLLPALLRQLPPALLQVAHLPLQRYLGGVQHILLVRLDRPLGQARLRDRQGGPQPLLGPPHAADGVAEGGHLGLEASHRLPHLARELGRLRHLDLEAAEHGVGGPLAHRVALVDHDDDPLAEPRARGAHAHRVVQQVVGVHPPLDRVGSRPAPPLPRQLTSRLRLVELQRLHVKPDRRQLGLCVPVQRLAALCELARLGLGRRHHALERARAVPAPRDRLPQGPLRVVPRVLALRPPRPRRQGLLGGRRRVLEAEDPLPSDVGDVGEGALLVRDGRDLVLRTVQQALALVDLALQRRARRPEGGEGALVRVVLGVVGAGALLGGEVVGIHGVTHEPPGAPLPLQLRRGGR
mmetsp:Transcript_39657/g.99260  ORF Transcript_39657/g.99260 Transcript_39657/m.99260 type:complete len:477 (+) Transcript_39657:302-1732(+)